MEEIKNYTGFLEFNFIHKRTELVKQFSRYPIKFILPQSGIALGHHTKLVYVIGYGGGLVSGDDINIKCILKAGCHVILCTQASTKIFKAVQGRITTQFLNVHLEANSVFAYIPDPVICYEDSNFIQNQRFYLESNDENEYPNFVLVDWVTSGRCNIQLEKNQWKNENWKFKNYTSKNEIFFDNQRIFIDNLCLCDDEEFTLVERMEPNHVLGMIIVIGQRFQGIMEILSQYSSRRKLQRGQKPVPSGRVKPSPSSGKEVEHKLEQLRELITSASPMRIPNGEGIILRFASKYTETIYELLRILFSSFEDILGYEPYSPLR